PGGAGVAADDDRRLGRAETLLGDARGRQARPVGDGVVERRGAIGPADPVRAEMLETHAVAKNSLVCSSFSRVAPPRRRSRASGTPSATVSWRPMIWNAAATLTATVSSRPRGARPSSRAS